MCNMACHGIYHSIPFLETSSHNFPDPPVLLAFFFICHLELLFTRMSREVRLLSPLRLSPLLSFPITLPSVDDGQSGQRRRSYRTRMNTLENRYLGTIILVASNIWAPGGNDWVVISTSSICTQRLVCKSATPWLSREDVVLHRVDYSVMMK